MARKTDRDTELSTRPQVKKDLIKVFADVEKGFADQRERADDIRDYWDIYNCRLGERQFYSGNSQIFLPLAHDAIEARKTRFANQMFPQAGRYVEVTTEDGEIPHATMSLLEYYVRWNYLRTRVVRPLLVNGDVEGQYSVYVSWKSTTRNVVSKVKKPVMVDGLEHEALGKTDDIKEEEIKDEGPCVEVISDSDLLVLPQTVDTIEDALEAGGSVTIQRRWTKAAIRRMIKDGEIVKDAGEALIKSMQKREGGQNPNTPKQLAGAAGIRGSGSTHTLGYETWTRLKIEGDWRLTRSYYGGEDRVLGCKLCPYWCDKVPIISGPVEKVSGVFKGRPPIADVVDLQVLANDTINEGADTAHFSAMPIVMTDPEKNPRVGTMVLGLAAVWETSPNDTQFAKFPELWRDALERVEAIKSQVNQTLGVNPAMMPGSTGGTKKRNQAEIANEQQVDLLTTADAVTVVEEQILTPMLQRFAEYDHQFRDDEVWVQSFGEVGEKAIMEAVEPIQMNRRYEFRWFGVEAARNAAQMQQQIAGMNVIKGIPPQMYPGYTLQLAPMIVQMAENLFGPRLAPKIFVKVDQPSVDPQIENEMLEHGFDVTTHPGDDDMQHIQAHMELMRVGDPHGNVRKHLMEHQHQLQAKAQQQQQQAQGPSAPSPGGQPPAQGAQPGAPGNVKGPPGMINPDQMSAAGAPGMPRKM
jgi:hypothetical protein